VPVVFFAVLVLFLFEESWKQLLNMTEKKTGGERLSKHRQEKNKIKDLLQ
jgi:hypothetical protein